MQKLLIVFGVTFALAVSASLLWFGVIQDGVAPSIRPKGARSPIAGNRVAGLGGWRDCMGIRNEDAAISCFSRFINSGGRKEKDLAFAHHYRGVKYVKKLDYTKAIADFDKAIKLHPADGLAYMERSNAYSKLGQHDRVVADFDAVFKHDPQTGVAFIYYRGQAYEKMGDKERAVADYLIALEVSPEDKQARKALRRLGVKNANYDGAIKLDYKNANTFTNRGMVYEKIGDYTQAIAFYDIAIHLNPDGPTAYNNRGFAYFRKGEYSRAIADYSQAIKLNPKFATAYGNRGTAYYRNAELALAIADFRVALTIDPSLEVVRNNLTRLGMAP